MQVSRIVQQFRDSGVDFESMARALEQQFPGTTREGVSGDHALAIELRQALRLAVQEEIARLTRPQPVEAETVEQYAWRLHNLNPGASIDVIAAAVDVIAAAAGGPRVDLYPALKTHLEAMIRTRDEIVAAFGALRPISTADADRMGFRDAATHDEDEATHCLFGGALSTGDPNQRVIGLASSPSNPSETYSAAVNRDLLFMDLNKLAEHLTSNPTHPLNRLRLNLDNIHHFAFRLVPADTPGRGTQGSPSRAPAQAALTPRPAPETQAPVQVSRIVQQFRDWGVDLESMARALEQRFPGTTREGVSADHALAIELCQALRLAVQESNAAIARLTMPEEGETETEGQYAWRLHNLNPGTSIDVIAAATVGPSGDVYLALRTQLEAMIRTRDEIVAAFGALRPISTADADRMGFKDAATHDEDEATHCLFGGALSTGNSDQRVIGLAPSPSNPSDAYSAGVNKDLLFMDLNKLAEHLASNPTHPVNRLPLTPNNIHHFAFRLE